jgi:hypothetical protein
MVFTLRPRQKNQGIEQLLRETPSTHPIVELWTTDYASCDYGYHLRESDPSSESIHPLHSTRIAHQKVAFACNSSAHY